MREGTLRSILHAIKNVKTTGLSIGAVLISIFSTAQTITFSTPGGPYAYTATSSTLLVTVNGAPGGNNSQYPSGGSWPSPGGHGGSVVCTLSVTPGTIYYIYVGGAGGVGSTVTPASGGLNGGGVGGTLSGSYGGGGGGGASDIRTVVGVLSSRLVVAGGGGGAGLDYPNGSLGGDGGGTTAQNGMGTNSYTYPSSNGNAGGGNASAGGGAGNFPGYGVGSAGATGNGGAPLSGYPGGGGGGGYYGGGGGVWQGAGGGSSYTDPVLATGVVHSQGAVTTGNGSVTITTPCTTGTTSGPSSVCAGSSITLSNTVSGGTWTSSNPAIGSVGSATGIVTGITSGAINIVYSGGPVCTVTKPVTVNCAPTFTNGSPQSLSVCQSSGANAINSLLPISDADAGQTETWSVISGPSHGSITSGGTQTSTGGVVTPAGFSYTPTTGFTGSDGFVIQVSDGLGGLSSTTINVTVNAMPASITGPSVVCIGSNITLSNTSGGGVWSSSNPAVGTVGSSSGVVTGIASGNVTISYTLPGSCSVTYGVAVSPIPTITTVSSQTAIPGTSITLTGTNFNTSTSSNIVWFGAATGTVTSASGTSLTVTVPNGATYGPIIVENASCARFGYAPYAFEPTYNNAGFVSNTINFATKVDNGTPASPNHISFGDIDGDGKVDIISNNSTANSVSVYLNTSTSGAVSFASPVTVASLTAPGQPAVADIDGDGKADMVVTSATSGTMNIYRNTSTTGSISFAAPVVIGYVVSASASAIRDIDGDGRPDIVSCTGSTMSVFRNTGSVGSISFAARVDFASTTTINAVAVGDVDGDGKPDVLAANNTTNISAWRNTSTIGSISFAARQDFTTPGTAFFITMADIDGDGKLDVLNTNSSTNNVSIFLNTSTSGTISMGARTDFTTGATPNDLTVGDFDGGGRPDVAVASTTGGNVGVFRNTSTTGSISLATRIDFVTGAGAAGAIAVDIDNDGKMDLAVTNQSANTMSVLRNNPLAPITGTLTTCPTATTTLSDATTGGTWSSSAPGVASVGSLTGIVTGVSAGTAFITYAGTATSITAGNYVVVTVTVNPNPAGITGTTNVCTGATTTLADATGGGAWSSSNGAIGTVGSSTGVVGGVTAGLITISYTLPTGCAATTPVTVNQSPTNISGSFAVCVGATNTLTNGFAGGVWTSSIPANGTIGAASGVLGGITPGNTNITYTMTGNCAVSQVVTVNPNPAGITGLSSVCVGSSTTLSDATSGGLWGSSAPSVATITAGGGVVVGASAGNTTMSYTLTTTGCFATFPMTVNPNPAAITGAPVSTTFSYTGANQTFTVPAGVTSVSVDMKGGQGGTSKGGSTGGAGGRVQCALAVTAGQVLQINVGGVGSNGIPSSVAPGGFNGGGNGGDAVYWGSFSGGGGGGASDIRNGAYALANRLVIAAGAGGGGDDCFIPGGNGGGLVGSNSTTPCGSDGPGIGGSQVAGGTGGVYPGWGTGGSGGLGVGGAGANGATVGTGGAGGGGGGGYYGGGAGSGSGGGGGSSFTDPVLASSVTHTPGFNSAGNGSVTISYPGGAAPSSVCVGLTITLGDATPGGTWSSSAPAIGSVGSATGVVTGVSAGTTTISYLLPTGCYVTKLITVNANPAAITGTATVCQGLTTTLADATGTGSWSSSASGIASIGSGTGVVTGVTPGNATITYTLPTGCIITTTVTVNPLPAVITGTFTACPGTAATLSDATGGGTWTSNNTAVGTIGSASGILTGISAGTTTITYTLPTGCIITQNTTINPNPAAITGNIAVCVNSTVTMADGSGGGTWTSSLPANGTVGASTGVVGGISAGNPTITYTLPTGCIATALATVNPLPAAITGATNVCVGLTTTLTDGSGTSTWSSSNTAIGTVGAATGVVGGVSAGTINILFTLPTGCVAVLPFTVNPTPAAITGTPNVCVGSNRTLADATIGGTWSSSNPAFGTVSGTGVVNGVSAGTLNIIYTLPAGCTSTIPFTVNPTPSAIVGAFSVCTGLTTALTDPTGGGTWSSSNPAWGSVSAGGVVAGISAGIPVITYNLATGNCFVTQAITVNTTPSANTGTPNVCVGLNSTLANSIGGGTWSSSNPAFGTVGAGTGIVNGVAAGTLNIIYTLGTGCAATTAFTVNPSPSPITGTFSLCTGQTTTLSDGAGGGTWTSSNTAQGSIGSASAILGGIATGTPAISYTLSAGNCFVTQQVTINQTPPAIVGSNNLCIGVPTTMTDGIGGGTWTTSNGNATIVSTSGVATGVTPGTVNIIYTLPAGCFATMPATVNLQPASVAGAATVCVGLTTTLTDASGGGTWTSSNPGLGTVGSASGTVGGISAGTITITYTLPGGCTSLWPMTVNPTPAAIGGTPVVCVGSTVILTDATTGGTWSSSNTAQGSVGATSGIVSGIAAGNPSIIYTLPAGCTATVTATVNALPNLYTVTGGGSYCAGGAGLHIGLSSSDAGISYQLWRGVTAVGSALSGGGVLDFGLITTTGTYTVIGTNTSTGCNVQMTGSATIIINPLPPAFNVTGGGSYCAGGSGLHILLNGSSPTGFTYQLLLSGSPVGSPVTGTGAILDFGLQTAGGPYTVLATNTATGCTNLMNGTVTITVNSLPNPYLVTGGGGYCAGGIGMPVGLATSDIGISYQLFLTGSPIGSPLPGTTAALAYGLQTAGGIYTIVGTNVATGCVNSMTGSVTVTVNPLPTVFSVTGGGGYCAGGTGVLVGLGGSTSGVIYQLWRNGTYTGTSVTGAGGAFNFGLQTIAGIYTVVASNPATTCTNTMSGSVTVTINPLPAVNTVTGGGAYCAGGTGVHAGVNGSVIGVSYQLYNGALTVGGPIAGTGSPLDFGLLTTATTYTVTATNSTTSCVSNMAGSAIVTINPLPLLHAVTGGGGYCAGGTGVPVGLLLGDAGISYQLYNGISGVGAPVTGSGSAIAFGLQTAAGTYTVIGTNIATTCNTVMTGSVVVTVNPLPTPYVVSGGGSYCAGGTGVAVGLANSAIGVNYQLKIGGVNIGGVVAGTGTAITFGLQTGAGTYTVVATNATTFCTNNMTGSVTISINPLPIVYSVTGGGNYCLGGTGVHVGLGASNIGINYQLYFGAVTVGGPIAGIGAALDFGLMTAVGTYTVSATNTTTGCTNNMAGSAIVGTNALPLAFTVTGGGNYCAGGAGVPVNLAGSVAGVNYQLYNGATPAGLPQAGTGIAIPFGNQTAAGTYTVIATNGSGCTNTMTGFAAIVVNPLPNFYVVTGGGSYCTGGTGVHVGLTSSDLGINYQLLNPGPVGLALPGTGLPVDFGLELAGTYTVRATNGTTGCTRIMTGSISVTTNPLPTPYLVTGGGHYCAGGTGLPVIISGSSLGVNYQLYNGVTPIGTPMPGTTGTLNFGIQTLPGTYTVKGTDAVTGCVGIMTGSVTIVIDPLPAAYAVTGGGSFCPGGAGVVVGLNNSDPGTSYQIYYTGLTLGLPVSGTGFPISFGLENQLGGYTVLATNGLGCVRTMTGAATVSNYPLPNHYLVTGGGSYCAGGAGMNVNLSGSDAGINYQLYYGGGTAGIPVPGTGAAISLGLQTAAGTYFVQATNAVTGCTDTMLYSAVIFINPLPAIQTLSGSGNYCIGGPGADVALGGTETGVSYQLYKDGIASGAPISGTGLGIDFGMHTAAGIYTITGTNTTTFCMSTMAGSDTISINPPPVVYSVTGGGSYCAGGTGVHVGINNSQSGINYTLYNGVTAVSGPWAGSGSSHDFGLLTAVGVYTIKAISAISGCSINMSGSATVGTNPLPTLYNVTGGGGYCAGGTGVNIGLSGSATGISYQLLNGTSLVGSPMVGTGASLDFGVFTAAGSCRIVATNGSTGCLDTMNGSTTVVINPHPTVFNVTASGTGYCAGGTGVHVFLSNTEIGVSYQLYIGTAPAGMSFAGTGGALDFGVQTLTGTYTVSAFNTTTSCTSNMSGSVSVSINPLPATYAVIGGGSYCPGGAGIHVGLSGSAMGIRYQLYNGAAVGTPVNGNGSALDFGLQTAAGSYTVVATNIATGCINNMTGSVSVAINALPVAFTVTGGGSYCAGGTGVNVGLSGSVSGTDYQLYLDGSALGGPIAGTGIALTFGLQTITGTYTVAATNSTTSCSNNMTGSVTVAINPLPTVYLVTGGGNYCPGGTGVNIGLAGSSAGVNYQLYFGASAVGSPVAGTGAALVFGSYTGTGTYTVVATNAATLCTRNMSGSAVIGLYALPAINSVIGGGSYCAGSAGVHVGLNGSVSGISYRLYKNGVPDGSPLTGYGLPLDFGVKTDTGTYRVIGTNTATGCSSNMNGFVTVMINPVIVPTVSISTGGTDTVCAGNMTTFTATATGGGSLPVYQWTVNGVIASAGISYSYLPANGDVVTFTLVSNATCATPSVVSNSSTMTVLPKLLPSVTIAASPGIIVCQGTIVNFTATGTNGGDGPTYLWLKNGLHVGTATNLSDIPANGDIYYCEMTTNYACSLAPSSTSPHITMEVDVPVTPVVTLSANPGTDIGYGETASITAHLSNTVPFPVYKWYVNGLIVPSATTPILISSNFLDGDIVTCAVVSGGGCPGLTGSASLTLHVINVGVKPVTLTGSDIRLLPNPNKGVFTIKGTLGTVSAEEVSFEITDMLGQVIYKDKVSTRNGEIDEKIVLGKEIANGMYILSLHTGTENKVFHMVVEQ